MKFNKKSFDVGALIVAAFVLTACVPFTLCPATLRAVTWPCTSGCRLSPVP